MSSETGARRKMRVIKKDEVYIEDPFSVAAEGYLKAGWESPVPAGRVPFRDEDDDSSGKENIVTGLSGWKNPWPTPRKVQKTVEKYSGKGHNIALWVQPGILGIDVDAYKKEGRDTLARMEREYGILPATIVSTARPGTKSGIRYFAVPEDLDLHGLGSMGRNSGIEFCHRGTRIAVVPPSFHKPTGNYYMWYTDTASEGTFDPPSPDEATDLPEAWVDAIREGGLVSSYMPEKNIGTKSAARMAVDEWMQRKEFSGEPCSKLINRADEFREIMVEPNPHDPLLSAQLNIMMYGLEGHSGVRDVLEELHTDYIEEITRADSVHTRRSESDAEREWYRAFDGAAKRVMHREDEGDFLYSPKECFCPKMGEDGEPVPEVNTASYSISRTLPRCYRALRPNSDHEGLYTRGDSTVLFRYNDLYEMTRNSMRGFADERINFFRYVMLGEERIPSDVLPPDAVLDSLLADPSRFVHLPGMSMYIQMPTWDWGTDETPVLVKSNGYHAETGYLVNMSDEMLTMADQIPESPSDAQLQSALDTVFEPFADFPFDSQASKANLLGALITAVARPLVRGAAPAVLFEAPTPRTGKSLLADLSCTLLTGGVSAEDGVQRVVVEKSAEKGNDKSITEFAKQLVSALREAPVICYSDNLDFRLDSSVFAGVMTSYPELQTRLLGKSQTVKIPTTGIQFITSNNMEVSEENIPRMMSVRLDAGMEHPERGRSFSIPNVLHWAKSHRMRWLSALHTVVSYWVAAGAEVDEELQLGGFEEWAGIIGGIVRETGSTDLLGNRDEFAARAASSEDTGIEAFVRDWVGMFGVDVKIATKDLLPIESASVIGMFNSNDDPAAKATKLGKALWNHVDKVIAGHRIRKGARNGRSQYWVEGPGFGSGTEKRGKNGRRFRVKRS